MITTRIVLVIAAKFWESETNKTPQNKVAVPVIIASISSLLLISILYGWSLIWILSKNIRIITAEIAE